VVEGVALRPELGTVGCDPITSVCVWWLRWAVAVGGCSTVDAGRLHRVCYFAC